MSALPQGFADVAVLEEFMSAPSAELVADLARASGDILVLGVGGKMGPTLARMAKRAAPQRRVIGVARFSAKGLREKLESQGVECIACDLLERAALEGLPRAPNVMFMAGHKFGVVGTTAGKAAFTWAMNAGVPFAVAEIFRESRIVAFSTSCVYPYVAPDSGGAREDLPATPPPGDYANSCVARERAFEYGSLKYGTAGRLVRLEYAIDMRYGVLHDIAAAVHAGRPVDVSMGYVNVIWQGDANEQALRLLAHCTAPSSPLNVSGPETLGVRWLAAELGRRLGKAPILAGQEGPSAWLVNAGAAHRLLGTPRVPLAAMLDWTADWIARGGASLGKPTHFETRDGKY